MTMFWTTERWNYSSMKIHVSLNVLRNRCYGCLQVVGVDEDPMCTTSKSSATTSCSPTCQTTSNFLFGGFETVNKNEFMSNILYEGNFQRFSHGWRNANLQLNISKTELFFVLANQSLRHNIDIKMASQQGCKKPGCDFWRPEHLSPQLLQCPFGGPPSEHRKTLSGIWSALNCTYHSTARRPTLATHGHPKSNSSH